MTIEKRRAVVEGCTCGHPLQGHQQGCRTYYCHCREFFVGELLEVDQCVACGSVDEHEGWGWDTFGADLRCLRRQAEALGATETVERVDALQGFLDETRNDALRAEGFIPPEEMPS